MAIKRDPAKVFRREGKGKGGARIIRPSIRVERYFGQYLATACIPMVSKPARNWGKRSILGKMSMKKNGPLRCGRPKRGKTPTAAIKLSLASLARQLR